MFVAAHQLRMCAVFVMVCIPTVHKCVAARRIISRRRTKRRPVSADVRGLLSIRPVVRAVAGRDVACGGRVFDGDRYGLCAGAVLRRTTGQIQKSQKLIPNTALADLCLLLRLHAVRQYDSARATLATYFHL
jgi:hypothetical protein